MERADRIERRLKLHEVRVLMTVAESGSMGKAAQQLATSQSAVSRTISDLEHTLGVRLLDRSPQGVALTPYGRAVFNRGVALFDELRQTMRDIEFLVDPTAGEVRIAASIAVAISFVSALIDRLSRQHPRLAFHVLTTDNVAALRALDERRVDLVIGHLFEPAPEDRMNTDILFHEPHVVIAGAKNPLLRRRKLRLKDLMEEPWALPPPDSPFGSVVREAFRAEHLGLPNTSVTSLLPVRSALLATGRFLTMVPRIVADLPAEPFAFKRLPLELPTTPRPLGVITLKNRSLNPVAELFIARARDFAATVRKRNQ